MDMTENMRSCELGGPYRNRNIIKGENYCNICYTFNSEDDATYYFTYPDKNIYKNFNSNCDPSPQIPVELTDKNLEIFNSCINILMDGSNSVKGLLDQGNYHEDSSINHHHKNTAHHIYSHDKSIEIFIDRVKNPNNNIDSPVGNSLNSKKIWYFQDTIDYKKIHGMKNPQLKQLIDGVM